MQFCIQVGFWVVKKIYKCLNKKEIEIVDTKNYLDNRFI